MMHLSFYQFKKIPTQELPVLKQALKQALLNRDIKGSIMIAPEGINAYLAGEKPKLEDFANALDRIYDFKNLDLKWSLVPEGNKAYGKTLVKIKKEIIAFGVDGIDPEISTGARLEAETLKSWLDQGKPVVLVDTRNDYEVNAGTFKDAVLLDLKTFREFPEKLEKNLEKLKQSSVSGDEEPAVVMFCTGGIRCEKATAFAEQKLKMKNVFQLEGGILRYFEKVGEAHYDGKCYVFDERRAIGEEASVRQG